MKRKKGLPILFLTLAVSLHTFNLCGQDTLIAKTHSLDTFTLICPIRIAVANPGYIIEKPDSIQQSRFKAGTLTDLLGQNGILLLKTYGNGNLATTSIRGASASQTAVLWNGINLQSTTNGNVDLSLMPAIIFDNISLQNGGGSAGWGTGTIGGVIQTGNESQFGKGINIRYVNQLGSFGESNHGIKLGFSNSKFSTNLRVYRQLAGNNFTYRNLAEAGNPIDTVFNSYFFQRGIMGEFALKSENRHHLFSTRAWYQSSDRGIPPSMVEVESNARQQDEFFRAMMNYKFDAHGRISFEVKSAVLTEYLDFYPGYLLPNSLTHSVSFINEVDCRIRISEKISTTFGINNTWSKANVTQYVPITIQNRASAFAAINYLPNTKWNLVLNLRNEEVNGKITPLVGSFGAEWTRYDFLTLKTSFSKNYRIPTFNDLYWVPGGNRNLKAEESWNEDISALLHFTFKKIKINYSATAYYRITKNWILWQPSAGNSAIWSPENLLEVWSRGFEHRLKIKWSKNKFDISFLSGYDYVRATNEISKASGDESIGKQLIYVPANHFYGMLQFAYRKFYLTYNHQFNGLRFTSTDHSTYLPAYDIGGITIGKRIDLKGSNGDFFIRANNIFDKEYQAIAWRPMPGRSFQIGITLEFNKPNKTQTNFQ